MANKHKVLKALELCTTPVAPSDCSASCFKCPYTTGVETKKLTCIPRLLKDSFTLLKEENTKTGRWIYCEDASGHDGYKCSECGFFEPWYYGYENIDFIKDYELCPSCGSKMYEMDGRESE